MRNGVCRFLWGAVLLLLPALPARALDVLQVVPADVWGVAVVRRGVEFQGQWDALATQVPLPLPNLAALFREELAEVQGIDWEGSFAAAWLPADEPMGTVNVFFLAVRDPAALRDSIAAGEEVAGVLPVTVGGESMQLGFRDGYAVLVESDQSAALKKTLESPQTLAVPLRPLEAHLRETAAFVATTPSGIRMVQQQVLAGLEIARQQADMMPQGAAGFAMYEGLFSSLDQEVTHAMAGLQREEDGSLRLVLAALFAEGGVLAELAGTAEPPQVDLFGNLPAGEFFFAAGGSVPQAWSPHLLALSMWASEIYFDSERLDAAQREQLAELNALSLRRVHAMAMQMGVTEPDQPLYGNSTLVMHVDDAPAYIADYARAMDEMAAWLRQMEDPPFAYTSERIEIAGRPGLRFDLRMEGLLVADDMPPGIEPMFQSMFGSAEQLSFYLAASDERTVLGTYVSQQPLERMLAQPARGFDSLPTVSRTLALLPAEAQAIGVWSVPGMFAYYRQLLGAMAPEPGMFVIPEFPASPPIGVAIVFSERCGRADVVLPRELLEALASFVLEQAAQPGW